MKPRHLPKPFTTFPPISPLYFLLISIHYRTFWQAAGFGWAVCQQEEGQKPFSSAGKKTTLLTRQLLWKIWKDSRPGDNPLCKLVGTEGVAGICGSNQLHPTLHLLSFKRTWPRTVLSSLYFIIPKGNLFWKPNCLKNGTCHNYAGLSYVLAVKNSSFSP